MERGTQKAGRHAVLRTAKLIGRRAYSFPASSSERPLRNIVRADKLQRLRNTFRSASLPKPPTQAEFEHTPTIGTTPRPENVCGMDWFKKIQDILRLRRARTLAVCFQLVRDLREEPPPPHDKETYEMIENPSPWRIFPFEEKEKIMFLPQRVSL